MVARKIILKVRKQRAKPLINGVGICTGKSSNENKLLGFYYSNFSGIDDLYRNLKEDGFTVSETQINFFFLQNQNSYPLYHPAYHTFKRRSVTFILLKSSGKHIWLICSSIKMKMIILIRFLQSSIVLVNVLGVFP